LSSPWKWLAYPLTDQCKFDILHPAWLAGDRMPFDLMKRRKFITLLGGAAAWPLVAKAQRSTSLPRIGVLSVGTIASSGQLVDAFVERLNALGYIEGKTVTLERRYALGQLDALPKLAAEIVSTGVNIIFAPTGAAVLAAQSATQTIPIVFALVNDPVGEGFVSTLAHPGGRMTGMTNIAVDLAAKRLEILQEVVPHVEHVGALYYTAYPGVRFQLNELERAANAYKKSLLAIEAGNQEELSTAFERMKKSKVDAAVVIENPFYFANREKIVRLAASSRLPAMYNAKEHVQSGGLMSYGASYADLYRRAASYVDKILKGAKPADLPVEQPTTFELVINVKAATAIGLQVPPILLARADEVIE
jgi:putative tryptophan/tyrosine transport system substrate-binding protein